MVAPSEAGERLDRALAARDPTCSRATLQRWIKDGRVTVDGVPAAPKTKLREGQRVEVRPAPPPPSDATPEDLPLTVLYEDAHLLVVDKAAGMVVHPAPGHPGGTLVNAVLGRYHGPGAALEGDDPQRPGIVHRLDALTSGVMVVARTLEAKAGLVARFQTHDIDRFYLAIASGRPPDEVTYDTLHGRHPRHRKRFSSQVREGKRAVTHVVTLERLHGAALVRCTLETGRTHQIRVHLADAGFPLIGDPVYARAPRDPRLREAARALGRQALHAARLGFEHPVTRERLTFDAPPPPDFEAALDALREDGRREDGLREDGLREDGPREDGLREA